MNNLVINIHVILLLQLLLRDGSFDEIDDYVNLISGEQERIKNFILPKDSQDEKPFGSDYIEYRTFDHIVVGGGSAGSVVASRLSEDTFRNVLVLEAGGPESDFAEIAGMSPLLLSSECNWNQYTTPQTTSCLGMNEKRCAYPRGKVLGGSSTVNALMYVRGSKQDYNNWCAEGNPGWCYEDVLPFFKKSENSLINGDAGYHGYDGYLHVEHHSSFSKKTLSFIKANQELKVPVVDYNGIRQEGVGLAQFTQKHGRRDSANKAFLKPALNRTNLKVEVHSHVTRILINSQTKKAFGVVFARDNQYYVARSRRDIVISAGAIGSPQLLMLSGIRPKSHLEKHQIPVLRNLDVGKNFQDHVVYFLYFNTNISTYQKPLRENVVDYLNGRGPLTGAYGTGALAFLRTNLTTIDDFPDIELIQSMLPPDYNLFKPIFNYNLSYFQPGFSNVVTENTFSVVVVLLRPKSRGYVKLKSSDPFDYPLINSKLLSDPNSIDIETLYQGIQLTLRMLETKAWKAMNATLMKVHLPDCKNYEYLSKPYWYCQLRMLASSFVHTVGTCKMGPNPSQGAVVDHNLRVHGIKNLRVADISVIPILMGCHTNAPAIMIGEKVAYMIKTD